MPRPRRHDPGRRERIADAALEVIADHGVAGATHRRIAAAADVPLGSMTYHFDGLEDVLRVAFTRHAERAAAAYGRCFDGVRDRDGFVDAVAGLVDGAAADERGWVLNYELYLLAQRDPGLRPVTEGWMRASRAVLEQYVAPEIARGLDGLVEGLQIHRGLSTDPPAAGRTRAVVDAFLAGVEVRA